MNFDAAQRTYDAMLPPDDPQKERYTSQDIDDKVDELMAANQWWELAADYEPDLEQVNGLHIDEAALEAARMLIWGDKAEAEALLGKVQDEMRRALWWAVNYKINMGEFDGR
jgi:hypothetical protein